MRRAMLLCGVAGPSRDTLEAALLETLPEADITVLRHGRRSFGRTLPRMLLARPDIVIVDASAPQARAAAWYRSFRPHSRLLLCAARLPRRPGPILRLVLRRADGILSDASELRGAIDRLRFSAARLFPTPTPSDLDLFLAGPVARHPEAARRLIHVGPLSPDSGAADVLIALAAWAEQHPAESAEIWWAGDGDLAGVLAAQPLPANLSQRFLGPLERRDLARTAAECGILVAPCITGQAKPPLLEALASGLVILGSRRIATARHLLRAGIPGWSFDPLRPTGLADALDTALRCTNAELDALRATGRAIMRVATADTMPEQAAADHTKDALNAVLANTSLAADPALG